MFYFINQPQPQQQLPREIQYTSQPLYSYHTYNNNNFQYVKPLMNQNVLNHPQIPNLSYSNSARFNNPTQSYLNYSPNYQNYDQFIQQSYQQIDSISSNINEYQKPKQMSVSQESTMEIERSSYNNDQPQNFSRLNFEKPRQSSQSECSWKRKKSNNGNYHHIQIIQSIGKQIEQIRKNLNSQNSDSHSLFSEGHFQYLKSCQQDDFCLSSQEEEEQSSAVQPNHKNEVEMSPKIICKGENECTKQHEQKQLLCNNNNKNLSQEKKEQLFFSNLKEMFLQQYKIEDEQQLVVKIQEELSSKLNQKDTSLPKQVSVGAEISNKAIDDQYQIYLKCVFLNFSSEINHKFSQYYLQNNNANVSEKQEQQMKMITFKLDKSLHEETQFNIKSQKSVQINSNNQSSKFSYQNSAVDGSVLLKIQPKSISFLKNFDFSDIRQNYKKKKQITKEKNPNSSYVKNSQFHNLNKLFMYNILSMFRTDSLNNLNLPQIITQELCKIVLQLKISSRRDYKNPNRGFFDYFSHSHYKVLFLKINKNNINLVRQTQLDIDLHKKCFNIDLSEEIPETELTYMNLIKEINFRIFQINIQEHELFDDGTDTKQNIRRKYAIKVIEGIKKLVQGLPTKRF